jgi:CheY-like chemotaxis protein
MSPASSTTARVLLVDDNRDGLLVRRLLLEEAGYSVVIADNGTEGLRLYQTGVFDLLVTDFHMPGMNGVELIQHVRGLNPRACVILLSGFVEIMGLTEESTGADVVLAKASNEAAHLVRSARRLINRAHLRKPPASQKRAIVRARTASL